LSSFEYEFSFYLKLFEKPFFQVEPPGGTGVDSLAATVSGG